MTPRVAQNSGDVAKRVLVLVDGLHARELIEAAARLVDMEGAHVLLVYVHPVGPRAGLELAGRRPGGRPLPPHRVREADEAEHASGVDALAEAAGALDGVAASVDKSDLRGDAGRLVCDSAARWRADVIVLRAGGRDRPPVGPPTLGPAARFITDHAPCTVLLIR